MKSIVMKSIYTSLGLLATGKETVEEIGRKLAKKVNLTEKDGEKIARHLKERSEKAMHTIQKTVDAEVNRVVHALHAATGVGASPSKKSNSTAGKGKRRRSSNVAKPKAKTAG
jgi:hypothetical protein